MEASRNWTYIEKVPGFWPDLDEDFLPCDSLSYRKQEY